MSHAQNPSRTSLASATPLDRFDWLVLVLIVATVIASRVPFRFETFSYIDSVHYALGVEDFDVTRYRPHPPGYILFIGTAKFFYFFLKDVGSALFSAVQFYSALSVVFLYLLSRVMFNRTVAVVASALFGTVPVFWFHGDVALSYVAASCFATLVALAAYKAMEGRSIPWLYATSLFLGLCGGVRQDLIVFIAPLALFAAFYVRCGFKHYLIAVAILCLAVLGWLVPTALLSGGFAPYFRVLSEQTSVFVAERSIFTGGTIMSHAFMFKDYLVAFAGATLPGLLYVLFFLVRRNDQRITMLRDRRFWFLVVWIVPANMFLILIFFLNHGYLLSALPAIYIGIAWAVVWLTKTYAQHTRYRALLAAQVVAMIAVHSYLFIGQPPFDPGEAAGIPAAEKSGIDMVKTTIFKAFSLNNHSTIKASDLATSTFTNALKDHPCMSERSALLILHRSRWGITPAMYYLRHPAIFFVDDYNEGVDKVRIAGGDSLWFESSTAENPLALPRDLQCMIVICQEGSPAFTELREQMRFQRIDVGEGFYCFVTHEVPARFRVRSAYFAIPVEPK